MKKWPWYALSLVVVAADQLSKYWALTHLMAWQPEPVIPMINLTLAFNSGAAFSFLSGTGDWHKWFFAGFSVLMCGVLATWLARIPVKATLQCLAISLILGGAAGNLYDRAVLGHVVDFIDVYYQHYHWPVFNLADSAICLGAFFLIIDLARKKK